MAKKIVFYLNNRSIGKAIKELEDYKGWLNAKAAELTSRLADIGLQVASIKFANADYAGTNDVTCRVEKDGTKATIYADGAAVAFIEFGTGVSHPEHPSGMFKHGTYGQGKGKRKMWGYYGEPGTSGKFVRKGAKGDVFVTSGNPPAMAMYDAVNVMTAEVTRIAREVFRT